MKPRIIIAIAALLSCTLSCFAKTTPEEYAQAAKRIVQIIDGKIWTFIPKSVELPSTVRIERLQPDDNNFRCLGDKLYIHLDYIGGDVLSPVTPYQGKKIARNVATNAPYIGTIPPMYQATCNILSQEISVSKNNKWVTVKVEYDIVESNFSETENRHYLELEISTKDMVCNLQSYGMHYDETYVGYLQAPQPK